MAPSVYLSLGSNSPGAAEMVRQAILRILNLPGARETGRGGLYRTQPQGKTDQPWFVNTALAVELNMDPAETLRKLKRIEADLGRTPGERWGPREIDIDIIFFGDLVMTTDDLTIPHPLAARRRFVLTPLADINPALVHPALGATVAELLAALPEEGQELCPLEP